MTPRHNTTTRHTLSRRSLSLMKLLTTNKFWWINHTALDFNKHLLITFENQTLPLIAVNNRRGDRKKFMIYCQLSIWFVKVSQTTSFTSTNIGIRLQFFLACVIGHSDSISFRSLLKLFQAWSTLIFQHTYSRIWICNTIWKSCSSFVSRQ